MYTNRGYKARKFIKKKYFIKCFYLLSTYGIKRKIPVEKLYKSTPIDRYTHIRVNIL